MVHYLDLILDKYSNWFFPNLFTVAFISFCLFSYKKHIMNTELNDIYNAMVKLFLFLLFIFFLKIKKMILFLLFLKYEIKIRNFVKFTQQKVDIIDLNIHGAL